MQIWRWSGVLLKQCVGSAIRSQRRQLLGSNRSLIGKERCIGVVGRRLSTDSTSREWGNGKRNGGGAGDQETITREEAKKLMKLVNVEALKTKLEMDGKEVIEYSELLDVCEEMGVARTEDDAASFARVLDDAGVVLILRDKVYLQPDKVVELIRKAVPIALLPEDDTSKVELRRLQEMKEDIDMKAHKQVRRILWTGLGFAVLQVGLFFRLTFWEFSWDVMEPITFFTTAMGLVVGYAYFLFTSADPSYQDMMRRLYLSRQKRLIKRHKFDFDRFVELQKKCNSPLDAPQIRQRSNGGVGVKPAEELLHGH